MAILGAKRLSYIDRSTEEPPNKDPKKYSNWVSENMLLMNLIPNSMVSIGASFQYCDMEKELN